MLPIHRIIVLLVLCLTSAAAHAADGELIWARSIGGTGSDTGNGIAVDDEGNVYITGNFTGTVDFDPGSGTFELASAGETDIFVQKLDSTGNLVWAQSMGGLSTDYVRGIAVDNAGYIYTVGYFKDTADFAPGTVTFELSSAGSYDIFVQKLDNLGSFVWARSMGGTSLDDGYGIALDSSGNVHITGSFNRTVDFDPGSGIFNLTSNGESDIFVQKLDASGNFVWARSAGGNRGDYGASIAVDDEGNVCTTGQFQETADFDPGAGIFDLTATGELDIFVQKLDVEGKHVWAHHMGGAQEEIGLGIALDSANNIYTTGLFQDTVDFDPGMEVYSLASAGGSADVFVHKLDASGKFVWARSMRGTGVDYGTGIAVDDADKVYCTGRFEEAMAFDLGTGTGTLTSTGLMDIFVQKLDAGGNHIWVQSMGGTKLDAGSAIAAYDVDTVYTTGIFAGTVNYPPGSTTLTSAGGWDMFVQKLGPDTAPPNVTSIVPDIAGVTNATSVDFTVTFDKEVQDFDAPTDLVINHSGTAHTGESISGGQAVYTVTVSGITGDGSFTLAVNTASDVQDLAGNALANSATSAAVIVDNTGPAFTNLVVNPSAASVGDTVTITFDSSEPLVGDPEVTVNGNPALLSARPNLTYAYTVLPEDDFGAVVIDISGVDLLGNRGSTSDGVALTIIQAEGEGTIEGSPEGDGQGSTDGQEEGAVDGESVSEGAVDGEVAVEGTLDGEGEGIVEGTQGGEGEGAGEGEGEGENPPAGSGGCNATGGPMEKSIGDWLAVFLGFAVLLGAHLSLRSRLEA